MSVTKYLYIAEKPSVARAFASCLGESFKNNDGYMESQSAVVTWCLGHLISMSYPDAYDEKYKKWRMETLPFIPENYIYEVIGNVKKQFKTVKGLLNRADVSRIYVCTDSGREGEYIYRLVRQEAKVRGKEELRVWINSQTEDEIKRGIAEARPLSDYDLISDCAYLRAKEDYLMGINFSRVLSIKYGNELAGLLNKKYMPISVGRVMTCVLGMVVRREREIRDFVKRPFFRVFADFDFGNGALSFEYKKDSEDELAGFPTLEEAEAFIKKETDGFEAGTNVPVVDSVSRKKEKKVPPLLYNLAELQNEASKAFKISPEQTLNVAQKLYERGLTTYPRTDARVLSSAVAKEIGKNLNGLNKLNEYSDYVKEIHDNGYYKKLAKSRYVDDKKITDHYAIIPTGQGQKALSGLSETERGVYDMIVRRFLAIFFPESVSQKVNIEVKCGENKYIYNAKVLIEEGYRSVLGLEDKTKEGEYSATEGIKKNDKPNLIGMSTKKGETTPPKRYTSGSMILAMENAGKLIEDESLREQIAGSGIGTSATRAGIIEKLCKNKYLALNKKTQVLTPTLTGEMIFDVVQGSIPSLLNPDLTASWEKGLFYVEKGEVTKEEYMSKLSGFIVKYTVSVKERPKGSSLHAAFNRLSSVYKK